MNRKIAFFLALAPVIFQGVALADNTESKPGVMMTSTETMTATVTNINKKTREVTLKDTQGNETTVVCGEEVKNFDQIKKGDVVTAEYTANLALYVRKSNEPLSHEESAAIQTAQKGQKPGMHATKVTKITAQVEMVNYDTRMMTLRGPKGNTMTFKVGEEVKRLNEIKKGDQVVADYTEAVAINVTPGKK